MDAASTIREQGFRRWYERQLVESHLWLVTGLLALIMMALTVEMVDVRGSFRGLAVIIVVGGGGAALTWYAWLRFTRQLALAEHLAGQATCASCREYAKLEVVAVHADPEAAAGSSLRVRCRRCSHGWTIA